MLMYPDKQTEKKSLVKYLIEHGYTFFMIPWKNPVKRIVNQVRMATTNLGVILSIKDKTGIV